MSKTVIEEEVVTNRRPLKTRDVPFFRGLATTLAGAGVTPNTISASSMLFAAVAGLCFAGTSLVGSPWQRLLWFGAAAGIQFRLLANMLDGMVAVEGKKGGPTGELWNEAPDRVADVMILLGAGYAAGSNPLLGWAASVGALFVAYVRALGASAGVGQVFVGPMAKPQRMFWLTLVALAIGLVPAISNGGSIWVAPLALALLFGATVDIKTLSGPMTAAKMVRLGLGLLVAGGAWMWMHRAWAPSVLEVALISISLGTVVTSAERLFAVAGRLRDSK